MFSYYGSKSKIVDYYPPPKYGRIIEPFAGSARYSLKYWDRDVLLVDKYHVIVEVWKWLINATKSDIMNLPILKKGDDIRLIDMPDEARKFVGFCINVASTSPKNIVTEWGEAKWISQRKNIANNIFKIKKWNVVLGSYNDIQNEEVTWFIDPPYQYGGEHYKQSANNIDFGHLSEWCKSRMGQVIVCENTKATWMDFTPMVDFSGAYDKTTEAIWSNLPTNYDNKQLSINI